MMLLKLAWKSLLNRRASVLLTLAALTMSVVVVIGVEHIRGQVKESFARTVSGVDLIVGARTSQINLLLYSVFHIGNATNNISWESYREIADASSTAWTIPISLGDSHRGFRVVGTSSDFFEYFQYGNKAALTFMEGTEFAGILDTVVGYEVAKGLGYEVGDSIVLSHGLGAVSFSNHEDAPFTITGILAATGTPVDQTVMISLQGMEAIHVGWQNGTRIPGLEPDYADESLVELQPDAITAFMLGLESRSAVFGMQRAINEYQYEALSAILPGVALSELWETVGAAEKTLSAISALVMFATLLGMASMLLSSMKERQREISLYRALGAHSSTILILVELEALLITILGIITGFLLVYFLLLLGSEWLVMQYGLIIEPLPVNGNIIRFMLIILGAALLLAIIPAVTAYSNSLATRLRFGG